MMIDMLINIMIRSSFNVEKASNVLKTISLHVDDKIQDNMSNNYFVIRTWINLLRFLHTGSFDEKQDWDASSQTYSFCIRLVRELLYYT